MAILCRILLILVVFALPLPVAASRVQDSAVPFARLFLPIGVTVDNAGNVYTTSDAVTTTALTKFAPDGTVIGQSGIGGITVGNIGRLTVDPGSGLIVDLLSSGQILVIDPNTLQVAPWFDARALNVDTSAIYDIVSGTIGNGLSSIILPQFSQYGDIALLRFSDALDVFLSGSSQGFPFVMRVRVFADGSYTAKVLVSTLGPTAPTNTLPRGVTVNRNGIVMTTLPITTFGEYIVAFRSDFPETGAGLPQLLANGITSRGMATDSSGNFYIATGFENFPFCNGSGGAFVIINADLTNAACSLAGLGTGSNDVAVDPSASNTYLTMGDGAVWRYTFSQPPAFDVEVPGTNQRIWLPLLQR